MAHTSSLIQSGAEFFVVTEDGGSTELTLPSTVNVSTLKFMRSEVNGVHAVVVNTPDQPLIVDDAGIVLFLSPLAPTVAPTTAVGVAGALTGTYKVKYTFAIRTIDDTIVAESGFSPSSTVVLTSDKLAVSNLQLMPGLTAANYDDRYEVVRRVYRTSAGTDTYFLWYTVEDNTTTSFSDDATDASISALAAANLATAPYLSHVAGFRERLFGVNDSENREVLLYSETGLRWAWPTANTFTTPQVKGDSQSGITALMPRRDALGIAKSNMLMQLTGTDDTDFRLVTLSTSVGCLSQESAAIFRDNWYFLGNDGVYRWGEDGLTCISDGKVRSWFTTDDYFDRDVFDSAFGIIDTNSKTYKLYLVEAGATAVSVWVEYDIESGTWWGPHRTTGYEFTSALTLSSHHGLAGIGTSTGYVAIDTDTRSDDGDVIEMEAITVPMKVVDPPVTAYWGNLSCEVAPQATGTLSIYPTVGELSASEGTVMEHDLATANKRVGRLGYGRFLKLRFYNNSLNQIIQLLGFEVNPLNIVGRRN